MTRLASPSMRRRRSGIEERETAELTSCGLVLVCRARCSVYYPHMAALKLAWLDRLKKKWLWARMILSAYCALGMIRVKLSVDQPRLDLLYLLGDLSV